MSFYGMTWYNHVDHDSGHLHNVASYIACVKPTSTYIVLCMHTDCCLSYVYIGILCITSACGTKSE